VWNSKHDPSKSLADKTYSSVTTVQRQRRHDAEFWVDPVQGATRTIKSKARGTADTDSDQCRRVTAVQIHWHDTGAGLALSPVQLPVDASPSHSNITSALQTLIGYHSRTAFIDYCLDRFFLATRFSFLFFPYFFVSVLCARLSWPSRQLLSPC